MSTPGQSYQIALRDLELRRAKCKEELQAVEQAISGLQTLLARDASLLTQIPQGPVEVPASGDYAGLSVRWGVLKFLAEDATEMSSTAEIANALREGGMTSAGRDFVSNVSAVISVMVNKRGELIAHAGTYGLSDAGRAAWDAIKSTTAYQNRPANLFSTVQ
jgi:hypothetical protein